MDIYFEKNFKGQSNLQGGIKNMQNKILNIEGYLLMCYDKVKEQQAKINKPTLYLAVG